MAVTETPCVLNSRLTVLSEQAGGEHPRTVLLVAEGHRDHAVGLLLATEDEDDDSGATAQVKALYVLPDDQGRGIGRLLFTRAAAELMTLGLSRLHIGVLTWRQAHVP